MSVAPKPTPLSATAGSPLRVGGADDLLKAVDRVKPGQAILLRDGVYRLSRGLNLRQDRIRLCGESGVREAVVLDFATSGSSYAIMINGADDVTVGYADYIADDPTDNLTEVQFPVEKT